MRKVFLLFFSLFFAWHFVNAQQIVTENGKAYKLHKVVKGEGLYRLSVDNGVSQEDIIAANPSLKSTGLVEGVVVRIPIKASNSNVGQSSAADNSEQTVSYVVRKGETVYGIASKSGISVAKFLSLNPQSAAGIHEAT